MNPLLLPGPQFLVVYALLAVAVFVACWAIRARILGSDAAEVPGSALRDPYEIAVLRDGHGEAVSVGLLALASRGAAHAAGDRVRLADVPLGDAHPFERAIAEAIGSGARVSSIEKSPAIEAWLARVSAKLASLGFLCDDERTNRLVTTLVLGGGLLATVGLAKLRVALSTGHTNVVFLVMAMPLASLAPALLFRRRTFRGDEALAMLQGSRTTARPLASDTSPATVAFSAALFGLGVAPVALQPFVGSIRTTPGTGSSGDGGGCGGDGGCGGGCGGCGGCGG